MSERPEQDSKTEEPTEKKIQDALDKGNVPFSREATTLASMLGMLLVLSFFTIDATRRLAEVLARFMESPGSWSFSSEEDASSLLYGLSGHIAGFLLPALMILLMLGVASSLLQNAPSIKLERVRPKLSKLSLKEGVQRVFGRQGQVEFLKALFKFALIGVVAALIFRAEQATMITAMFLPPNQVPHATLIMAIHLLAATGAAAVALAIADIAWSRYHWRFNLRMTRQEVKDEFKQVDGDPLVKARLRSLARDRQRKRMILQVPRATLVIANPTHYATALRYVRAEGGVPVVVAKGKDLIALKIREIAEANGVPVIEDKPLARSIYDSVEVDQMIPPEFYKVVAELIFYLEQKGAAQARPLTPGRSL